MDMKECADLGVCDVEFFTKALDQHLSPKGTAIISQLFSLLFISLTLSGNEEFHTNEHEFDTMSGFENEFPLGMYFKPKLVFAVLPLYYHFHNLFADEPSKEAAYENQKLPLQELDPEEPGTKETKSTRVSSDADTVTLHDNTRSG